MKVLNFGSLNIDCVYGVDHFVKKGETISSNSLNIFSGGKGLNQSIALAKAGIEVYHAGAIGIDGIFLEESLKNNGINTRYIKRFENICTGNAIIQNDVYGDNCILLYGGANQSIDREFIDSVLTDFGSEDWLILQNEISEIPYIVDNAHSKGMKIVLNPSPMDEKIFKINLDYIDCLLMNEIEARSLIKEKYLNIDDLTLKLGRKFPDKEIVLTLGEEGAVYIYGKKKLLQSAYKVRVVDTTAAGDTFTGYFIAARLQNKSIKECMEMATRASAIAVSKKGASPSIPTIEMVQSFRIEKYI